MEKKEKPFNVRAFVTLVMLISGLGLPISGIANHLHQFEAMNTPRHVWMSAHNGLGLLFVLFSIAHVVLNRRALLNHLKGLTAHVPAASREAVVAATVVACVLFLFVGHAFLLR